MQLDFLECNKYMDSILINIRYSNWTKYVRTDNQFGEIKKLEITYDFTTRRIWITANIIDVLNAILCCKYVNT